MDLEILYNLIDIFLSFLIRYDDDWVDRACHKYTAFSLIIASFVHSICSFYQILIWVPRISCWVPAHFTEIQEQYANEYCWTKSTYYLPFDDQIPGAEEDEHKYYVSYYQWVPIILMAQGLLFYLPIRFWRTNSAYSGINLMQAVKLAKVYQPKSDNEDDENLRCKLNEYFKKNTELRSQKSSNSISVGYKMCFDKVCGLLCGRRKGNYLATLYLLAKLMFIMTIIIQIIALNAILGEHFSYLGIYGIVAAMRGEELAPTTAFPRVTMCDFIVRRLGNNHRYTVQCVLPMNLFNEMLYIVLWTWMIILLLLQLQSFITWASLLLVRQQRKRYIKKYISLKSKQDISDLDLDEDAMANFLDKHLMQDGVFIIKLLSHNTNEITTGDIVFDLWNSYGKHKKQKGIEA